LENGGRVPNFCSTSAARLADEAVGSRRSDRISIRQWAEAVGAKGALLLDVGAYLADVLVGEHLGEQLIRRSRLQISYRR
jgi:hypothetical protein